MKQYAVPFCTTLQSRANIWINFNLLKEGMVWLYFK